VRPHGIEGGRPDARHVEQAFELGERPVFAAMVDDPLGGSRAEPGSTASSSTPAPLTFTVNRPVAGGGASWGTSQPDSPPCATYHTAMPVSEAAIATASTRCERAGSAPGEVMSVGIGRPLG
jgi:hypothetical protein